MCGRRGYTRGFETVWEGLGQEKGRQKEGKCRRGGVSKGACGVVGWRTAVDAG